MVWVAASACSEMEHMPCVTQQVKGRQQEDPEKKGTMSKLEVESWEGHSCVGLRLACLSADVVTFLSQ